MRVSVAAVWLLIGTLVHFPCAFAQGAPDPSTLSSEQREELGRLLTAARDAYESERYELAVEHLRAAHRLYADPDILYRIGESYENAGDLENAVRYYERYVTEAIDATDRGLVSRRVTDLRRELDARRDDDVPAPSYLVLDSVPIGAKVRIDGGDPSAVTPTRLEIEPGLRRVELSREGHETVEREVEVGEGETISLVYRLEKLPEKPSPEGSARWPLWVGIGGGAVALGGGASLFVAAKAAGAVAGWDEEREQAYRDGAPVPPRPDEYDGAVRRNAVARPIGIAGLAVGGALLGTAVVGWWLGDDTQVTFAPSMLNVAFRF